PPRSAMPVGGAARAPAPPPTTLRHHGHPDPPPGDRDGALSAGAAGANIGGPSMNPPLWLALHFPLLALEAVDGPSPEPRVLVRQQRITLANAAARGAGVSAGLRLGTARALCDDLQVQQ